MCLWLYEIKNIIHHTINGKQKHAQLYINKCLGSFFCKGGKIKIKLYLSQGELPVAFGSL